MSWICTEIILTAMFSTCITCYKGINSLMLPYLQFTEVPKFYEETYLTLARQGSRVIALGYRHLGVMAHSQVFSLIIQAIHRHN